MGNIFNILLSQPIYNLLVFFYDTLPIQDIGISIILVTFVVKGILFPLTFRSLKSQKEMQEIQPKIKEIREKYKNDKEKQAQELMNVYKEHKVNPLASCFPLLIQLPIFIALFQVLRKDLSIVQSDWLYSFIANPITMDPMAFGIIDVAKVSVPLAILAAIAQYFQAKQTMAKRPIKSVRSSAGAQDEDMAASMNKMMLYMMPVMTLVLGSTSLPAGIMLYWTATTVLTLVLYAIFLPKKEEDSKKSNDVIDVKAK